MKMHQILPTRSVEKKHIAVFKPWAPALIICGVTPSMEISAAWSLAESAAMKSGRTACLRPNGSTAFATSRGRSLEMCELNTEL